MGRFCQLIIGPAGSGKTTYCSVIAKHLQTVKRPGFVVNLDPAAESLSYEPTIDIRDLITLKDAMEEMNLGPNGGLMFCMEYLLENIDWLEEAIGSDFDDEYMLVDCPGQIELFTHSNLMKQFINVLVERLHFRVCCVYILESQFIVDVSKFFSGVITAMSSMVMLELPHINVLSKMDLIEGRPGELIENTSNQKDENCSHVQLDIDQNPHHRSATAWTENEELERDRRRDNVHLDNFLEPDTSTLLHRLNTTMKSEKWRNLNSALVRLIDDFNMVAFLPLNIHDEDSIAAILSHVDNAIQFGEDEEPRELKQSENDESADAASPSSPTSWGDYIANSS